GNGDIWKHTKESYVHPQPPPIEGKWVTVKAEPWGAGYRARIPARKPFYTVIHPGSTILKTTKKQQLKDAFKDPQTLIKTAIATQLGYATIIPIP
nr:hypothetical protein [Candidatus Freyrarchaeum guaymaensis]